MRSCFVHRILTGNQGSKCPSLPGFTHWVNPGKPGLGFKPYFGKSGEYWVIKYFKCSDVQNWANLWILRQERLLDNKEHMSLFMRKGTSWHEITFSGNAWQKKLYHS